MIIKTYKDYSINDISRFAELEPNRYEKLCKIVGEFELAERHLYLGITLPYKNDKGCVVVSCLRNSNIYNIDTRYF